MRGVFLNANDINLYKDIPLHQPPLQASSNPIPRIPKLPIDHFTVVCWVIWPLNGSKAGDDLGLIKTSLVLSYKCTKLASKQLNWHNRSSEVCIRTRSPTASLPFKGQVTEQAAAKCALMYQSIPKPPIPPGQPPGIWLALSSVQRGIWPKWGPPSGAFDFRTKTSVSGQKQKDCAILWFSKWAPFTGHCSCGFHVGFSVVVVLYSYIMQYAFV